MLVSLPKEQPQIRPELLVLILLPLLAAPLAAATYADRVHETLLPNGLKLILLEDHKAPIAVFQTWYRVGSRNESLGKTGLSHLLEHMMFKGTDRVGPEEYSRIIQRNGGQTNAFTTHDYTMYFASIASDRLHVVSELEADRMVNLKINEEMYGPEREVVKEERRMRVENNPEGALFEQLAATAYAAHPYQFPVIGWMNDIAASRLEDLLEHYRTYYVPNNAFIVAVGDFSAPDLAAALTTLFGNIPSRGPVPSVRSLEPPQLGERRVELRRSAELPTVAIAYHAPKLPSTDAVVLDVLSDILSGGKSSRLYQELVYRRRLARYAATSYESNSADAPLFMFYAQALPGVTAARLEKALLEEIERVRQKPPAQRELKKAKNGIEAQFVFAQDSLFYQAFLLGQFEISGDWRRLDEYLPAVRAVTADDVMRVAQAYFDEQNRTVATLIPLPKSEAR